MRQSLLPAAVVALLAVCVALLGRVLTPTPAPPAEVHPPGAARDGQEPSKPRPRVEARPSSGRTKPGSQPRSHGERVDLPLALVEVDDGDTLTVRWQDGDVERVRILGIDTPETRHSDHGIAFDQSFGPEARTFAQGVFAAADRIELLRADKTDPYGRTLAYVFVNGKNYSVLAVRARLAAETVSHYGDNGLPREAAEVLAAAEAAGPPPFEPPHLFRSRMRELEEWQASQRAAPKTKSNRGSTRSPANARPRP